MKKFSFCLILLASLSVIVGTPLWGFPTASAPGLYVNSAAEFAVKYPQDWVEQTADMRALFKAASKRRMPMIRVWFLPNLGMPVKNLSGMWVPRFKQRAREVKVLYDRETSIESGVPAREFEMEFYPKEDVSSLEKIYIYFLGTKNKKGMIVVALYDTNGTIGESLKNTAKKMMIKSE